MEELFSHFQEADSSTLALFDVDMVLIQPSDPAFQMANMMRHRPIVKQIIQDLTRERRSIFLSLMTIISEAILVDHRIPDFLTQLRLQGITSLALTANLTGEFCTVKDMAAKRIRELYELGIDFSQNAPLLTPALFQNLPKFRGNCPSYTDGILFSNSSLCPKGDALVAFLHHAKFYPKKVIFVDDHEENIKSVELALQQLDSTIEFHGIHFLGANDFPSKEISETEFKERWMSLLKKSQEIY